MSEFPENIKHKLIKFIDEIPVEKYSDSWNAAQIAIAMLNFPSVFKTGTRVHMEAECRSSNPGSYENNEMAIDIWPQRIHLHRIHRESKAECGNKAPESYRYTFPSGLHSESDFDRLMDFDAELFRRNYKEDCCGLNGNCFSSAYFSIETRIKYD